MQSNETTPSEVESNKKRLKDLAVAVGLITITVAGVISQMIASPLVHAAYSDSVYIFFVYASAALDITGGAFGQYLLHRALV